MRGDIKASTIARKLKDFGELCYNASFSISSSDMDKFEVFMGIANKLGEIRKREKRIRETSAAFVIRSRFSFFSLKRLTL